MEFLYEITGLILSFIPIGISVFAFLFFYSTKEIEWHSNKLKKVWRGAIFLVLICLNLYLLHTILFVDPEVVVLFWIWSGPVGASLIGISILAIKKGLRTEKVLAVIGIIVATISIMVPLYHKASNLIIEFSYTYLEPIKMSRLANSDEAKTYKVGKSIDLSTWKTFTSREGFYTVRYPSWWIGNTNYGHYSFGDGCIEICDVRTDSFTDSIDYEDTSRDKKIRVEYYVGFINPHDPDGQIERRLSLLKDAKTILLDQKYPAKQGVYTTNDEKDHLTVITTQPINGTSFFIMNDEPNGGTDNIPIFEQFIASFKINSEIDPKNYDQ